MKYYEELLNDLNFNELIINKNLDKVNIKLKQYIEEKVLPEYDLND